MRERVPPFQNSNKKGTKSVRLRRPLCVRVFRILEGWNALTHSFSRGFCTLAINSFRRQWSTIRSLSQSGWAPPYHWSRRRRHIRWQTTILLYVVIVGVLLHCHLQGVLRLLASHLTYSTATPRADHQCARITADKQT